MNKREIAKRMKQDEAVTRGDTWINRQVKKKFSGKGSLKSTGKNEGENMMMGKNNTQRA